MTVNVILRGHTYQLWWNQASSLNRTSIRLTSPAYTLCRYQLTKFSFADNCHSSWTMVVLYGCKYISFILLVMMMQSYSLLCKWVQRFPWKCLQSSTNFVQFLLSTCSPSSMVPVAQKLFTCKLFPIIYLVHLEISSAFLITLFVASLRNVCT